MAIEYINKKGKIGNLEIKNRLVMTAMGVGIGEYEGNATDEFIRFYTERAKGGAGLIITEITRVNEVHGIGEYDQLSLAKDSTIPSFKKLADEIHKYDSKIFVQLHHPGREANIALMQDKAVVVSSSAIPSTVAPQPTRALETEEVESLVSDFAKAACRAKKAGIDGVEIHAGHGYLVHQFLSPADNKRTDKYGGSPENRRRFLMEIIAAVKAECGDDYPISVRISSSEFLDTIGVKESITVAESIETAIACEKAGADLINVSAGTHATGNTIVEPTSYSQGWKIPLVAEIKKHVSVPVAGCGVIRDPEFADEIIKNGSVDFVAMGRSWLADPEWGVKAIENRGDDIRKCLGCMYCFETAGMSLITGGQAAKCSVNPYMGHETEYGEPEKDGAQRTVVVVGSGPAGLESALVLAQREFKVVLFEKNDKLGGQMHLSAQPPHKEKMANFIKYASKQLADMHVDIRLNTEATAEEIKKLEPYAVFICTGSTSIIPGRIPGVDRDNVYVPAQILDRKVELKEKRIVIAGSGLTGMETAVFLSEAGNDVTIIDMVDECGKGAFPLVVMDETSALAKNGVRTMPGHKLLGITDNGVDVEDNAGIRVSLEADAVVMSLGVRSVNNLVEELTALSNVFVLGEAEKAGQRIPHAVHRAFELANKL